MKLIIGASKSPKIGSALIRWWMGTDYSHVYARWEITTQDRDIVYHAANGMVHFKSFENFLKHSEVVKEFELDITTEQFKKFSQKCIDLAGEKYSKLELLQILVSDMSGGRIHFQDQSGYICSELMGELLSDLGIKFSKPCYLVRPDDIIKALEQYGFKRL